MSVAATQLPADSFAMICIRCDRTLLARREWVGREVQCAHCASTLCVPDEPATGRAVRADPPSMDARQFFYFGCARCGTLLEAHTGMCGHGGACPTCGARLCIPHLDERGQPLPAALRDDEPIAPTPLHAYAASGAHAPRIVSGDDGERLIECPRCRGLNALEADACAACGAPFTMEAAVTSDRIQRDGLSTASLACGIIAVPLFALFLPALLALGCWVAAVTRSEGRATPIPARVGAGLGLLSLIGGAMFWMFR